MILSTYSSDELRNIISTGNAVLLKNVKGLGLKTAQKIIVELSGKMLDLGQGAEPKQVSVAEKGNAIFDETMAALIMLGFQKTASEKVVKAILSESPAISVEDAVRQALRRL
jgi:Holliday junction DNA helicase RuvA